VPILNSATLFAAWERGLQQDPVRRALTLLAMAWPERSTDEWASTIIGERDEYLLRLRDETFGSEIEATTACAACGERLVLSFTTHSIRAAPPALPEKAGRFYLRMSGYQIAYRLPTSADLIAVTENAESDGREILLKRCVDVSKNEQTVDPSQLPERILKKLVERMAAADPQAEVQIELACPACEHRRSVVFDILSYLWSEIDDWAHRLLIEVHALASAYGWSEAEIMTMSARRRNLYLQMIER
jgi:hypothetical protein